MYNKNDTILYAMEEHFEYIDSIDLKHVDQELKEDQKKVLEAAMLGGFYSE